MYKVAIDFQVKQYSHFEGIDVKLIDKQINIKMFQKYTANLATLKNYYLLDYANSDPTGFFDTPNIKTMFRIIDKTPKKAFALFDAMFVQNFSLNIIKIYQNPEIFADIVRVYFSQDLSNRFIFGYITFPAIYGYFSMEEFTASASKFLCNYFKTCEDSEFATILLKSFMKGVTLFFDHFLCSLGHNMSEYNELKDLQDKHFFDITNKSIKEAIPTVSQHHISALEAYVKAFPKLAITFFVENMLYRPYKTAASACPYFHNQKRSNSYLKYLDRLKNQQYNDDVLEFLNSFVYCESPKLDQLSFGKLNWHGAIPLIISDVDVKLFYEICTFYPNNIIYWPKAIPTFRKSFSPVIFDVYPCFPYIEFESFGEVMFGPAPSPYNFEDVEEYNRTYAAIIKRSKDSHVMLSESIKEMGFPDNVEAYLLNELLKNHKESYFRFLTAITKEQYFREFMNYCDASYTLLLQAVHHKSLSVFKNILLQGKSISDCIIDAICYKAGLRDNISPEMYWELILAVMDSYRLKVSKRGYQIVDKFKLVLYNYVPKNFNVSGNKRLADCIASKVDALSESHWTFGKMLRQVIAFEKQLHAILGDKFEDLWTNAFCYALMSTHRQLIVFPVFLFCHSFILSNDIIATQIPDNISNSWHNFCAGMWSIICTNDEFLQLATNHAAIRKMFTYPE
ncbi:hypothetical protein TVAG_348570 [Trichomonas vaginalis G3]|uniref:Uncharacterized protein n=1 Tax=Trichomonas vaginalis (strain ATCC PRA-98 / G3) TaxID=412133 RepID=A2DSZ7_TRIV3|nr:hypothetical protein TVAGG3_1041020 [Trichomonas vaginalis G3]EAY16546.1 hypothetical protein TVAG_348570 [Trichomonas vaginalis G3]KAI5493540.1 hypothetical protein TVAGG3_1041020 [Trichomonas vaginalis G3]|eukprot:XP_001328769.1 hypothetical protein [Trichomonas vaginalis G3]